MGFVAKCPECGLVHKEVFWTAKDQRLLFLIAWHSERKPTHRIEISKVEWSGGVELSDDQVVLSLVSGWIESPDIGL